MTTDKPGTRMFEAWAASMKFKPDAHRFLAGRYFFGPNNGTACRTALFETRDEARAAIRAATTWYTKGRPVRVRVTVEVLG
jgi:hypothetical protein